MLVSKSNSVTFYPLGDSLLAYELILRDATIPNSFFNNTIIYTVVGTSVLMLYPFIQRYFVRGRMIGSLKG